MLMVSSCIIDPLYIQVPQTYWLYSQGTQTARVCFEDDVHCSILQQDTDSGATQDEHGTYTTDGHRVLLTGNGWTKDVQFVRTFSHLKNNSTNKNLTPLKPKSHSSIAGSVWGGMVNADLHFAVFGDDGKFIHGTYRNVIRREGRSYGWEWKDGSYNLSGNQVTSGSKNATLYEDFMVIDTLASLRAVAPVEDTGTSALKGTFWTTSFMRGSVMLPGVIVFNGSSSFTRILATSELIYQIKTGTYTCDGTSITFTMDGNEETCPLAGNRFTYYEMEYSLDPTPKPLP